MFLRELADKKEQEQKEELKKLKKELNFQVNYFNSS